MIEPEAYMSFGFYHLLFQKNEGYSMEPHSISE